MDREERAQSGLDRLMLFVLAIIVVVVAIPFVLGLGGVDVRAPQNDTADATNQSTDLTVLSVTGETTDAGVGVVRVVVTRNGSGETIDATTVSASWTNGGGYALATTESASNGSDGAFGVSVDSPSDSGRQLAKFGDRATYTFDLGADDVDDVPEFGRELRPTERVTLQLTTDAGKTTAVVLTVPENIEPGETVNLRIRRR